MDGNGAAAVGMPTASLQLSHRNIPTRNRSRLTACINSLVRQETTSLDASCIGRFVYVPKMLRRLAFTFLA